ncbi:hypothetical protein DERF_015790 [Dermatophagoides farinae]|uniref:Uncharacterized protein n=1 Tax=Dermatophagoides farinae TaxID=6954 RepID=A0A922HMS6_DERFA|nr:hypothetical protein DERF_015790 [Dermatophagoides farinae]
MSAIIIIIQNNNYYCIGGTGCGDCVDNNMTTIKRMLKMSGEWYVHLDRLSSPLNHNQRCTYSMMS